MIYVSKVVLDGVDEMLLGAETLQKGYPVEMLQTVTAMCCDLAGQKQQMWHMQCWMAWTRCCWEQKPCGARGEGMQ